MLLASFLNCLGEIVVVCDWMPSLVWFHDFSDLGVKRFDAIFHSRSKDYASEAISLITVRYMHQGQIQASLGSC